MSEKFHRRLPAEWEEQDAVLMAWPHKQTDWATQLPIVEQTFCNIIRVISHSEPVLLVVPERTSVACQLAAADINLQQVHLFELPCNDTWARDFGPITVQSNHKPVLLDFTFNGWGNKFRAQLDNRLTAKLQAAGAFKVTPLIPLDFILEGGSIESDGAGTLLTSSTCLLENNRNPHLSRHDIEDYLKNCFGARQVLWLNQGALQGDDTDSHIDTLARFAPGETILFQGCQDPADPQYSGLHAMSEQLAGFSSADGQKYRLLELPCPQARYNQKAERLPATYANFLIINGAVLVPIYNDPADQTALRVIKAAFPQRKVIPIDCCPLIEQYGSLHCLTMQLPKGVLTCA